MPFYLVTKLVAIVNTSFLKLLRMSCIKVYVHFIWATRNRFPFLTKEIRYKVFAHILENEKKNIHVDCINEYKDHVHCLVTMNDEHSIGNIAQLLKGESSYWINQNKLTQDKFSWQNEYFAIAVGDKDLPIVRKYIANQEAHHSKMSLQQEHGKFIQRYGFNITNNDWG